MNKVKKIIMLILVPAFVFLQSCGSASSNFYLLTPIDDSELPSESNVQVDNGISIGIGSLEFPDYLDRPQMAEFKSANQLEYDEFNRWAEPLIENFKRVLTQNLSMMIPTNNIYIFTWQEETPKTYQITLEVTRFDKGADSLVTLNVRWSTSLNHRKDFLMTKYSTYSQKVNTKGYSEMVSVMSNLVAMLSKDIAAEIRKMAE
ncbi:MAG: membrane integrity-associated transporter subunit PqiC [Melioribacteraceae bacterium]|nr:membrane integrity-associated transporter subunit PqiC [Melioribacteraceae bacterium]